MRFVLYQLTEFAVQPLYGQAHNVVERALDALDADVANPLLDAIRAGLVEGSVGVDVVGDLLLA